MAISGRCVGIEDERDRIAERAVAGDPVSDVGEHQRVHPLAAHLPRTDITAGDTCPP